MPLVTHSDRVLAITRMRGALALLSLRLGPEMDEARLTTHDAHGIADAAQRLYQLGVRRP